MLKRKIIFYRWTSIDTQKPVDPHAVVDTLYSKIHSIENFEILDAGEYKTAVLPSRLDDITQPARLQMLSLRGGTQLPARWSPDSPLESINLLDNEYSADVTHLCIWPDGIAAQEFHPNAPRLGRLGNFLRNKLDIKLVFEGLYNPNMHERLVDIRDRVRLVHISLVKPEQWEQSDRHGAFRTLFPAIAGEKTPSLKVAIGMGRYGPRDHFLDPEIQRAAFEIAEEARDQVDSMIIGGISNRTGKMERVNLLNERLHVAVDLPADGLANSVPESTATFSALSSARVELDAGGLIDAAVQAQAVM